MPASLTHHCWEILPVEGMPIEVAQLGFSAPVTYHLLVPKGRERDAVAWLRAQADRWEAVEARFAAQQAAKAQKPAGRAIPAMAATSLAAPMGQAAPPPPTSPAAAAAMREAIETAKNRPPPPLTQAASGMLTDEAAASIPPTAICAREDCKESFNAHQSSQPFPHLVTGCPGWQPEPG